MALQTESTNLVDKIKAFMEVTPEAADKASIALSHGALLPGEVCMLCG